MSAWRRRLEQQPDRGPVAPLVAVPASNGEVFPDLPSRRELLIDRLALDLSADAAARAGMDRRRFLQTAAGVAAFLTACNRSEQQTAPTSTTRASTTSTSRYVVPEPADVVACEHALSGKELIVDVHTHHVVPDGPWRDAARSQERMIRRLVPYGCAEDDGLDCLDRLSYLHDIFLASDTTIALLSDVPNGGPADAPLPWEEKRATRRLADELSSNGAPRVLLHDVLAPNFGPLDARLADMEATADTGDVAAFKVYTAWGPDGRGWALDDPAIGLPVLDKAHELGVKVFCAHKGLPIMGFDQAYNGPRDLVACAARYPDMQFVVYHGAFERETVEGAYDPARAARGISSLVKAMDDHGIPPNSNVWAELGTTWRELLDSPTQAAHALGKLLNRVGEDRVLWGTDAIWLGSPQPQIMAFRAFEIGADLQERHGYPALTPALKAKILGGNAVRLLDIDVEATRCALDADGLEAAKAEHQAMVAEGALEAAWVPRGPMTRREVGAWLSSLQAPWRP